MTKKDNPNSIVAIYWGPSNLQTEAHAARLGAPLYHIHYLGWKKGRLVAFLKYIPQFFKTLAVLRQQRPNVVYVAISPVFAALAVSIYCRLAGASYVMDVHNHALYSKKWGWSVPLVRALAKRALVNVVDQPRNEQLFQSWGVPVLILERPPIAITKQKLTQLEPLNQFSVTVINTFAPDEPLLPILEAAEKLPDVAFFVLGDKARTDQALLAAAPKNVVFTGYLNGDDYWNRLYSSQAIIALTTAPYSLLSGAIEAMALGKPPILSRQPALMSYFTQGTVFVDHTAESLITAVYTLQQHQQQLTQEINELNRQKRERWDQTNQELITRIKGVTCKDLLIQEA